MPTILENKKDIIFANVEEIYNFHKLVVFRDRTGKRLTTVWVDSECLFEISNSFRTIHNRHACVSSEK